jgi:outer membrane protein assembly factor BamD
MMIRTASFQKIVLVALVLLAAGGCGARQENLALLPPDDLYTRGATAFEVGDYEEAIRMLEYFTNQYLGDPRVPQARMMLGDASMARRQYATAATHYMRLVNDYPNHELNTQARFRTCEAYYRLSPKPPLDQEYTRSALAHCQSVVEYFPGTEEATQAAEYVTELRHKLAQKEYDTGNFYFRRRAFDSAVNSFQAVLDEFPETSFAPMALERMAEAYDRMGYVEDAEETRQRLLRDYPQSPQAQALRL